MKRCATTLLIGGLGLANAAGCLHNGPPDQAALEKRSLVRPADKARAPMVSEASIEVSRRVHELTDRIIEQNTFTSVKPIVLVLGVPEAVLFHRGTSELFISEGLVKKCKTEPELAAVLCSELGRMMSQKKNGIRVGKDTDTIPAAALPGGKLDYSGTREAELALQQRQANERIAKEHSEESQMARQLLSGAGFDPNEIDRVDKMVKQSERGEQMQKQLAGPAPAPFWKR